MKPLYALVLTALMPIAAYAQSQPNYGVKTNAQEQVLVLPQDQGKWYTTIFGDPADPRYIKLRSWFETDSQLLNLRNQTHFNVYETTSEMFGRYRAELPSTTCVRLQDAQGNVWVTVTAEQIPLYPTALYNAIRSRFLRRRCPGPNPCPTPQPQPEPQPVPIPEPVPMPDPLDMPPDFQPAPLPAPTPTPLSPINDLPPGWLAAIALAIGLAIGLGWKYKETYYSDTPKA